MTNDQLRELFKDVVSSDTETARQVALENALNTVIVNVNEQLEESFDNGYEACAQEYLYGAASEE